MRKLTVIVLLGTLLPFLNLQAQTCNNRQIVGAESGFSILDVILGDFPRFGETALKAERAKTSKDFWEGWFPEGVIDHHLGEKIGLGDDMMVTTKQFSEEELSQSAYWDGILEMLKGNYSKAVREFNFSEGSAFLGRACHVNEYRLIASYLDHYGDEVPLFSHFNGGFFTYCQDSLRWGRDVYDEVAYQGVVETLIDMIVLSNEQPVYFELLGDLMSQNSDQVTANWFGASAYLRCMHLRPDHKAELEEKAFYALEAPMMVKRRFDTYQFVQFKKHFESDLAAAQKTREAYLGQEKGSGAEARKILADTYKTPTAEFAYLYEGDDGKVAEVIWKAGKQHAEQVGKVGKFAGDVELDKVVKSDTSFNAYALVMIAVVIFSVVFVGLKARKNRQNM